MGIRANTKKLR